MFSFRGGCNTSMGKIGGRLWAVGFFFPAAYRPPPTAFHEGVGLARQIIKSPIPESETFILLSFV